ncbi:MAG: PAS domain-containing sensor histidine kinase [candidate division Zixibacteria bacterium]|nr:PAS domain-containing sensor histidine kinase [candidate division Zixibacteria bacterium]
MTARVATDIDRVTRCALCKIDLKGRFVFLDDRTEALLGYTKEELFGKAFKDFLLESDHELFFHIMRHQRTYETAYDAIPVTIINRNRQTTPATIIVTLGYIAGNPVNYQIIVQTDLLQRYAVASEDDSPNYQRFMATVLAMNGSLSLADVLEPIREFTGAISAAMYHLTDTGLETVATAPRDSNAPAAIDVSRLQSLLDRLAKAAAEPKLEHDQVQHGIIETNGSIPSEYLSEFELNDSRYLLRLLFENGDSEAAERMAQKSTLALRLVCRLLKPAAKVADVFIAEDECGPGLALFDALGMGAMFIRADATVAAANHSFARLCDGYQPKGSVREVIDQLAAWNDPAVTRNLANFFDTAVSAPRLSWRDAIKLPNGNSGQITIVRHSASLSDSSAWIVLNPARSRGTATAPAVDPAVIGSAVDQILSSLGAASSISDRLTHEFYDELHRDGNLYLSLLNGHMDKLHGMVSELGHLIRVWFEPEESGWCDLNLIVAGVIQELSAIYPETVINCRFSDLPKVQSQRNRLTSVIRNILSNSVKFCTGGKADVQIATSVEESLCRITVSDHGQGIPQKYLDKVFSMYYRVPLHPWQKIPGDGSSLAVTRQLVHALGGKMSISSEEGKGTTVSIELPVSAPAADNSAKK